MAAKIYKCFIASPSDTQSERDVIDIVLKEINETLGEQLNFRIESKKWENDSIPSFGEDGQSIINEQLLNDYQLFIGIMWNRFGSPTKRAGSGTEEEFSIAYKRYIEQQDIQIMLYFNEANINPNDLNLEQLQKVRNFKKKVSELGSLYSLFNGTTDFKDKLKKHLYSYFVKKLSGESNIKSLKEEAHKLEQLAKKEAVSLILKSRFENALCLFSNQPIVWIDPIISKTNEINQNADENYDARINIEDIISTPKSYIIKAPPQFGLSSLAHFFIKEAWKKNKVWLYLDASKIKRNAVEKSIKKELLDLNLEDQDVDCLVLDSWSLSIHGGLKLLRNLSKTYKDIPIIVMQTIEDTDFNHSEEDTSLNRVFDILHLLALPRNQIRKVVCAYNTEKQIGDENLILNKLISDLDVLNIHRTATNCLTLLKVSEKHFDESPVNRTKMLEMVLFVLFDLGNIPSYKTIPDIKDTEYILGRFCENMIRQEKYRFTRENFLKDLNSFCEDKLIDLEVSVVFDILFFNNIIINSSENEFIFRARYWIYYFAARRMHIDNDFRQFILDKNKYISFPEIIEFYSGIDRNREDLLLILKKDLSETCSVVNNKINLPNQFNPLQLMEWKPSEESINKMREEISEDVIKSKLPESVKDRYADRTYDQTKPYDQSIQTIFEEYSLANLMQKIKASSRALRNSDYVNPDLKRELLTEISKSWKQIIQVLFALTPIIAENGHAAFEGQGFHLSNQDWGNTMEERVNRILQAIPTNVIGFFKEDIFSKKIGPLIYDYIETESNNLEKHQMILLLVFTRPRGWKEVVKKYIISIPKNSFYLFDTVNSLKAKYRFALATDEEIQDIGFLLKMGYAKHQFNVKNPDLNKINQVTINIENENRQKPTANNV
jgi:hypothetical protein